MMRDRTVVVDQGFTDGLPGIPRHQPWRARTRRPPSGAMHRLRIVSILSLAACGGGDTEPSPLNGGAPRALAVSTVAATTIAGTAYSSSTRLSLSWAAPASGAPARYEVSWREDGGDARLTASTTATTFALTDLQSATRYRIDVTACSATGCSASDASSITASTPSEVWQFRGSGNSVSGLTRIVSDGNVKLHVLRNGEGSATPGTLTMYYGPLSPNTKGLAVGTTASSANYIAFTSHAGSSGLLNPPSASPLVREVATGQGVPLAQNLGARMRLYFEAPGADGRTRIMYLDSRDGYAGFDFNAGAPTVCSTTADYSPGGGCTPTVVIGVEGDAVAGNARLQNVRQFKIGVPTMTDWRWDGAVGTFMVFTTDMIPGCTTFPMNHGYAVWTGTAWQVQYDANGCPKLLRSVQAAHPLHLGGARYKMYYGDPSDQTGRLTGSNLPFLGPKKLIYADGARTGAPSRIDFEDWEATTSGRRIVFLWPDGSTLNATANGYIDDFSVVMPTGSADVQVLYVAITDGQVVPFAAAAVLVNP